MSCVKEKNVTRAVGINIDQFPLAVGNQWRYHHFWWLAPILEDTVILTIDSMAHIGVGDKYYGFIKGTSSYSGAVIFTKYGNQISIDGTIPSVNPMGNMTMTFPIKDGDKWTGTSPQDSFKIHTIAKSFVNVWDTFSNIYYVSRHYLCDTALITGNYMISPNIGFVHLTINEQYLNALQNYQNYDLMDYKLN
jgi:hypothetical protein